MVHFQFKIIFINFSKSCIFGQKSGFWNSVVWGPKGEPQNLKHVDSKIILCWDFHCIANCLFSIVIMRSSYTWITPPRRWSHYTVLKSGLKSLTQCLKITEKVAFYIASEASYVYILSGQKLIKNATNGQFWRFFENLMLAVKQCYQTGHF